MLLLTYVVRHEQQGKLGKTATVQSEIIVVWNITFYHLLQHEVWLWHQLPADIEAEDIDATCQFQRNSYIPSIVQGKVPVADVDKCWSLLWTDYDFPPPCSNHSKPSREKNPTHWASHLFLNHIWLEYHYIICYVCLDSFTMSHICIKCILNSLQKWAIKHTEYAKMEPSLLKLLQVIGWLHLNIGWNIQGKKNKKIS